MIPPIPVHGPNPMSRCHTLLYDAGGVEGEVFLLLAFIDAVSPGSIRGFLSRSMWMGTDDNCFMCLRIKSGFLNPIDCIRQSLVIVTTLGIDELTRSVGEVGFDEVDDDIRGF